MDRLKMLKALVRDQTGDIYCKGGGEGQEGQNGAADPAAKAAAKALKKKRQKEKRWVAS